MSNQPIQTISQKEIEAMFKEACASNRPPIRNYKVPPQARQTMPGSLPSVDFGIRTDNGKAAHRDLTPEECQEMFGLSQSIKMNFVPQMINALMLEQVTLLVNYCRDHRISDIKKHTRVLRSSVEEYAQRLADAYGSSAFRAYTHYSERFLAETAKDVWLMELQADTLCGHQLPDIAHREIASRTLIILMLIAYIQQYDSEMDRLIESKIGMSVRQRVDGYHEVIRAVCISIGEDLGYKVEPDKAMGEWVCVLSNRAWWLADDIIGEEGLS